MKKLYRIADITIQLSIPIYFEQEDRYERFAVEEAEKIDFRVDFIGIDEPVDQLEVLMDLGETCFCQKGDILVEMYCSGARRIPFRWLFMPEQSRTLHTAQRVWTSYYLRGYEENLAYISQIFKHICLNRMIHLSQGLMFHCSFIKTQGTGILFSGPSGIGKSTQAALWEHETGAEIINGDRAILRKREGKWYAYGLPYAGSSNIFKNESAPIGAIVILKQTGSAHCQQDDERQGNDEAEVRNRIVELRATEAYKAIISEVFQMKWDKKILLDTLDIIENLIQEVPIYQLVCTPDRTAVECLSRKLQEDLLI